jgi:hypothetical protein
MKKLSNIKWSEAAETAIQPFAFDPLQHDAVHAEAERLALLWDARVECDEHLVTGHCVRIALENLKMEQT